MSLVDSVCRELEAGRRLALCSVVRHLHSAPRHCGARMLVGESGRVDGTVGGGVLEFRAAEAGIRVAKEGRAEFLDMRLTRDEAAGADMICGGSVRVFAEPLLPDGPTKALFQRLRVAEAMGDDMFCIVPVAAPGRRRVCRSAAPTWPLPASIAAKLRALPAGAPTEHMEFDEGLRRFVVEPWPAPWRVLFLGGGHVALACAKLAAALGFSHSVVDDREDYATSERFPHASSVRVCPDYENCLQGERTGRKTFVLVLTRGHVSDGKALAQALRTDAGYVGMIGSRLKAGAIRDHLLAEGLEDQIGRVNSPVGLDIGAETPEEIAVSVMAQLVAARAAQRGDARHLDPALAGVVAP